MRRPRLIEIEFALLVALSVWGFVQGIRAVIAGW